MHTEQPLVKQARNSNSKPCTHRASRHRTLDFPGNRNMQDTDTETATAHQNRRPPKPHTPSSLQMPPAAVRVDDTVFNVRKTISQTYKQNAPPVWCEKPFSFMPDLLSKFIFRTLNALPHLFYSSFFFSGFVDSRSMTRRLKPSKRWSHSRCFRRGPAFEHRQSRERGVHGLRVYRHEKYTQHRRRRRRTKYARSRPCA